MKKDRQLLQLAKTTLGVEQIAARMDASVESVVKIAKRLGVRLPIVANPNAGSKVRK